MNAPTPRHGPGRPLAIKPELHPRIIKLYKQGYGYRAIATMLEQDDGVIASFSTVKRILQRKGLIR